MTRKRWITTGLVTGVLLSLVPLVTFGSGETSLLGRTVQDVGHAPLFFWITSLLILIARRVAGDRLGPHAQMLAAFVLALGFGVVTELIQVRTDRDADAWDLIRNGMGAASALLWWPTFDRRFDGTRLRAVGARIVMRVVAVLVLLSTTLPLLPVARAYVDRARRLPVLHDFRAESEARFMNSRRAWWLFTEPPESWREDRPERSARVSFSHFIGSALVFLEPYPDWSGYTAIEFEIFHPGEGTLEFGIRIDDRHRARLWTDRFGRHVWLEPGLNRVRIPLADVRDGPRDRELDLTRVKRVVLYPVDPVGGYELYLGPISLVSASTSPD